LFQYVPSGEYYARIKMDGKSIRHGRHGLKTDVFSTAKLKTGKFPQKLMEQSVRLNPPLTLTLGYEAGEMAVHLTPMRSKRYWWLLAQAP
jgi:hypothetical protein